MKGLMYREWTLLWDTWRWLLPLGVFHTIFVCFVFYEFGTLTCLLWSAVPFGIVLHEEQQHLNRSALILPATRGQLVTARYLLSLILVLLNAGFCILNGLFLSLLVEGGVDLSEFVHYSGLMLCLGLVIPTICYPAVYALGFLRGSAVNAVLLGLLVGITILWSRWTDIPVGTVYGCTMPVLFVLSLRLSIRFYSRREF